MPKTKISEYSTTNSQNTDIQSINIDEGCAPSGINNAIRELMVHLKNFQTGASSDPLTVAGGLVASGGATANTLTVTSVLTASGGTVLSSTNTLSGTTVISGNATLSGTTNTISGAAIITGNINSSGTNTFSGTNVVSGTLSLSNALGVASGGTGTTTLTGVVIGSGTSAFTAKTNPTGAFVGTTDSQTLTNKTISADDNTLSGIAASSFVLSNASGNIDGAAAQKAIPSGDVVGTSDTQTLTNKTLTDPTIIGTVLEDVYTISDGAAFEVDPGNGSIQLITLGASRTPKATNFAAGESVTLMVDDGSAYTLTWTDSTWGGSGVVWETDSGLQPVLATSGYTVIVLWKVSTQVYGARVGNN